MGFIICGVLKLFVNIICILFELSKNIKYPSNPHPSAKSNVLRRNQSADGILCILIIPRHNRHIGGQQPEKIVLNIQTVSTGSNSKRIYQGACSRTILCVGKQPVLSSNNKRSDRIFSPVVVYGNIRRFKKSVKIFLFIYRIAYRLGQLCSR